MANAIYIGLITCPLCGNENATVHEQKTGTKKGRFYYRCYTEINGASMCCGTIQCIGHAGQEFIKANLRPIGQPTPAPLPKPEPKPEPIGEPAPVLEELPAVEPVPIVEPDPVPEPIAPEVKKKSVWEFLTNDE